ncbi:MAG: hypothetical protein ABH868_06610 [bacterium]
MYLTDSEIKQLELLKKKTPAQRFLMMADLINAQIEAMREGLKYKNPKMSDKEIDKCFRERMKEIYSMK